MRIAAANRRHRGTPTVHPKTSQGQVFPISSPKVRFVSEDKEEEAHGQLDSLELERGEAAAKLVDGVARLKARAAAAVAALHRREDRLGPSSTASAGTADAKRVEGRAELCAAASDGGRTMTKRSWVAREAALAEESTLLRHQRQELERKATEARLRARIDFLRDSKPRASFSSGGIQ